MTSPLTAVGEERLRECPFCGDTPLPPIHHAGRWFVCCNKCRTHGASFWQGGPNAIEVEIEFAKAEAIAAWNHRSPVPEGDGLREVVADLVNNYRDQLPPWVALGLEGALASPAPVKAEAEVVAWPKGRVNVPYPGDPENKRVVGFVIEKGDPIYGEYGLSEPLAWLGRMCATPSSGGRREALEEVRLAVEDALAPEPPDTEHMAEPYRTGFGVGWMEGRSVLRSKVRAALVALANTNPTGAE